MGKNPFRDPKNRPEISKGQWVTPRRGKNCYAKWRHGEFREVLRVDYDCTNDPYGSWVLVIHNPLKIGYKRNPDYECSKYNPANFMTREEYEMINHVCPLGTTEAPKTSEAPKYYLVHREEPGLSTIVGGPYDHKQQAIDAFQNSSWAIKTGDEWQILKSVMKMEILEPRPPIRVTEFR